MQQGREHTKQMDECKVTAEQRILKPSPQRAKPERNKLTFAFEDIKVKQASTGLASLAHILKLE